MDCRHWDKGQDMTPARAEWLRLKSEATREARKKANIDEARRQAARDSERAKGRAAKQFYAPLGRTLTALLIACACHGAMTERLAKVTAYTPSIEGGGAGTGLTSTGYQTDDRPYGIAVDPRAIPYFSVIRVPGYRESESKGGPWHLCDDTGGAMRQATDAGILHIDVRMRNVASARAWGVRLVVVQIYTPDKE
jgi:3D (Asp-Asp-Asp) domain-containing protein